MRCSPISFILSWIGSCTRRCSPIGLRFKSRLQSRSPLHGGSSSFVCRRSMVSVLLIGLSCSGTLMMIFILHFISNEDIVTDSKHLEQNKTKIALQHGAPDGDIQLKLQNDRVDEEQQCIPFVNKKSYKDSLWSHADKRGRIILSLFDSSYVDMAFNLYETSFRPFNINNYMFIAADVWACARLQTIYHDGPEPIKCFTHFNDTDGATASAYGSKSFIRKTLLKTQLILEALVFGLKTLIVDLDIVFFRNPLPIVSQFKEFDISIQYDIGTVNTGFYFARPTPASIRLHRLILDIGEKQNVMDQTAMDLALKQMQEKKKNTILVLIFKRHEFPCGKHYFEVNQFFYDIHVAQCVSCVMVHNNWISGKAAKVYRFKEMGMWQYDSEVTGNDTVLVNGTGCVRGGYYTNPFQKYLQYDNPIDFGPNDTLRHETDALKAALFIGHVLNRTIILPTFHCYGCLFGSTKKPALCKNINQCFDKKVTNCTSYKSPVNIKGICHNSSKSTPSDTYGCTLNSFFKIDDFDAQFSGSYREHVFLRHRKVPNAIKQSQSAKLLIDSPLISRSSMVNELGNDFIFTPANLSSGARGAEIHSWFSKFNNLSVLRFHSLYGVVSEPPADDDVYRKILRKSQLGLQPGSYRQMNKIARKKLKSTKKRNNMQKASSE